MLPSHDTVELVYTHEYGDISENGVYFLGIYTVMSDEKHGLTDKFYLNIVRDTRRIAHEKNPRGRGDGTCHRYPRKNAGCAQQRCLHMMRGSAAYYYMPNNFPQRYNINIYSPECDQTRGLSESCRVCIHNYYGRYYIVIQI